jgi:hypothetical protein
MPVSFTVSGMGFAKLNATTMPATDITYTPNLGVEPFRSGGDINASMVRRAGARPVFRFTAPLASVWGALTSFLPVTLSAFEMHAALFSGPLRTTTGATQFKLDTTNGDAYAQITSVYPTGGAVPVILAEVTVYLCSKLGLVDPVTSSTGALPTLGATPDMHTTGPLVDNASAVWGIRSWRIDLGVAMEPIQADGFFYPTAYRAGAIQAQAVIAHSDVVALYAALTSDGKDSTGAGFILYARGYNMSTKVLNTTGYSFTFATAFAALDQIRLAGTAQAETGVTLTSYTAPGSVVHPITVATSATLPTG